MTTIEERFTKAAEDNGGILGRKAILSLMAEAWEEGLIDGVSHFGQMVAPPNPYEVKR